MKKIFNPLLESNIQKLPNNLTDIDTRSHTALTDIGTNTHAQIDTHIAATGAHGAAAVMDKSNVLYGVLGVSAGWTTAPTNLANFTDGSFSTVTGEAARTLVAAGDLGTITFDLGSVKTVLVFARVGIRTSASNIYVFIEGSDDNITYRVNAIGTNGIAQANTNNAAEQIRETIPVIINGRYLQVRCYVGAAATGYFKGYEIEARVLS